MRHVRGHLTPKMNTIFFFFFYRNYNMLNIFLFNNFFKKSNIFRKTGEKLFWRRIWQFFRERRGPATKINITFFLLQMRYWIFYYLAVFSKKAEIFWENGKKPFLGPKSLLKGRGRLATKMNITFYLIENEVLNIFSCNNFFEKSNIFGENGEKKFWGNTTIF